jgi:hypothetical protein
MACRLLGPCWSAAAAAAAAAAAGAGAGAQLRAKVNGRQGWLRRVSNASGSPVVRPNIGAQLHSPDGSSAGPPCSRRKVRMTVGKWAFAPALERGRIQGRDRDRHMMMAMVVIMPCKQNGDRRRDRDNDEDNGDGVDDGQRQTDLSESLALLSLPPSLTPSGDHLHSTPLQRTWPGFPLLSKFPGASARDSYRRRLWDRLCAPRMLGRLRRLAKVKLVVLPGQIHAICSKVGRRWKS